MTRLIVPTLKPRNPFVAQAHWRKAGEHGRGKRAERREGRQALQRELSCLDLPRDARRKPPGP